MKKRLSLVATLIVVVTIIISCRKDFNRLINTDQPSADYIESAKVFLAKGSNLSTLNYRKIMSTANSLTRVAANSKPFYKTAPIWKDAYEIQSVTGASLLVVPTKENRILNKEFSIKRTYIFTKKDGR